VGGLVVEESADSFDAVVVVLSSFFILPLSPVCFPLHSFLFPRSSFFLVLSSFPRSSSFPLFPVLPLSFHRSAVYEQAGRAVIPHSATFAGGHSHALDVEIKQFAGPGPCHLLRNGFGSKTGTFQQSSVFNSGRGGQVPLTMARHKSLQPREYENIGPGKKQRT
jgi:hypothetical protein